MKYTIGEAAAMCGVTVRTLRYYASIGLLSPSEVGESGYRYYDDERIAVLQQIVFYRDLGLSLNEIGSILSRRDNCPVDTLVKHRELLILERKRLDGLIAAVDSTIGGYTMKDERYVSREEMNEKRKQYAEEARRLYGETEEYKESERRSAERSGGEKDDVERAAEEIFRVFAEIREMEPGCERAQELVERWRGHISEYHYPCSVEILACLGQMYVGDERFRENLDRFGEGTAAFMSQAIECYATQRRK